MLGNDMWYMYMNTLSIDICFIIIYCTCKIQIQYSLIAVKTM